MWELAQLGAWSVPNLAVCILAAGGVVLAATPLGLAWAHLHRGDRG